MDERLLEKHICYVTRDMERAEGMKQSETYRIFCMTDDTRTSTRELLGHPKLLDAQQASPADILVFKPTKQIEETTRKEGWTLLNPPATLADLVEQKISQVSWLGELSAFLPSHTIKEGKDITFSGEPCVLQFNRAHTGSGTFVVRTKEELENIVAPFPHRPIKQSAYIDGEVYTCNVVVNSAGIFCGNISYQITGKAPFTDNPYATIGNDWFVGAHAPSETQKEAVKTIAQNIGEKLRNDGWKGLFGIDVIVEKNSGTVYLLEINARQPASTTFESTLQGEDGSVFEAHILSLYNLPIQKTITPLSDGAQLVLRNTNAILNLSPEQIDALGTELREKGFTVRTYTNTKHGEDRIRIQTSGHFFEKDLSPTSTYLDIVATIQNYATHK